MSEPKPLKWGDHIKPNADCPYHHVKAYTAFGYIQIEWKGHKERPSFDATTPWGHQPLSAETVEEAKTDVEFIWKLKLAESIIFPDSESSHITHLTHTLINPPK